MASEDFVIDIGLNIVNNKDIQNQLDKLMSEKIIPIRAQFEKIKTGSHTTLQKSIISTAKEIRSLQSMTPTQAVNKILGATPRPGTTARDIRENIIHTIQTQDKAAQEYLGVRESLRKMEFRGLTPLEEVQNKIRYETEESVKSQKIQKRKEFEQGVVDAQRLQTHLAALEGYSSPLEKLQDKIRQQNFANTEKQLIDARLEEDRRIAIEEHQAKILEIIAKNTGLFKKWDVHEKSLVKGEQRSILRSLKPGDELSEYQQKVLGVRFPQDMSKIMASVGKIVGFTSMVSKLAYEELTREASLLNKQAAVTGYSLPKERLLSRMGISNPTGVMSDIATFMDRARLGDLPFTEFGMFAPRTYSTRMKTNDPLAIWRAFKADVAAGEAKGWSKETIAQRTGMQDWLPTLNKTEQQVQEWAAEVASGKYQDERAKVAYEIKTEVTNIKEMMQDARSKSKTSAVAGGLIGAAALGAAPFTAGLSLPVAAALGVGTGYLGWKVGSNTVPLLLDDSSESTKNAIKNEVGAVFGGNTVVNLTIDKEGIDSLMNGEKYTRSFSNTQINDMY